MDCAEVRTASPASVTVSNKNTENYKTLSYKTAKTTTSHFNEPQGVIYKVSNHVVYLIEARGPTEALDEVPTVGEMQKNPYVRGIHFNLAKLCTNP